MTVSSVQTLSAVTLASLPAMSPQRLRRVLRGRRASNVVEVVSSWTGEHDLPPGPLQTVLASVSHRHGHRSLGDIWREALDETRRRIEHESVSWPEGMRVSILGDCDYPDVLARDVEAPAVLFSLGDLAALNAARVGIIGTRHATAHGRACARHFGAVLAENGVAVVSGLARGIDVSAHRGVLDRRRAQSMDDVHECRPAGAHAVGHPIGVVACGLDVVYPPEHEQVWFEVAHHGLLMTEAPPGTEPHAFRFPLRNRIIASLCDVLVVVESRITGGSMITVRQALERGVTVMAVPGSTLTRAAEGTNALIRDGAGIAVDPDDVLAVLGLEACRRRPSFDRRPIPTHGDASLLDVLGADPMTLDDVVSRSGRPLGDVAVALGRLHAQGWVMCTGGWFERLVTDEMTEHR